MANVPDVILSREGINNLPNIAHPRRQTFFDGLGDTVRGVFGGARSLLDSYADNRQRKRDELLAEAARQEANKAKEAARLDAEQRALARKQDNDDKLAVRACCAQASEYITEHWDGTLRTNDKGDQEFVVGLRGKSRQDYALEGSTPFKSMTKLIESIKDKPFYKELTPRQKELFDQEFQKSRKSFDKAARALEFQFIQQKETADRETAVAHNSKTIESSRGTNTYAPVRDVCSLRTFVTTNWEQIANPEHFYDKDGVSFEEIQWRFADSVPPEARKLFVDERRKEYDAIRTKEDGEYVELLLGLAKKGEQFKGMTLEGMVDTASSVIEAALKEGRIDIHKRDKLREAVAGVRGAVTNIRTREITGVADATLANIEDQFPMPEDNEAVAMAKWYVNRAKATNSFLDSPSGQRLKSLNPIKYKAIQRAANQAVTKYNTSRSQIIATCILSMGDARLADGSPMPVEEKKLIADLLASRGLLNQKDYTAVMKIRPRELTDDEMLLFKRMKEIVGGRVPQFAEWNKALGKIAVANTAKAKRLAAVNIAVNGPEVPYWNPDEMVSSKLILDTMNYALDYMRKTGQPWHEALSRFKEIFRNKFEPLEQQSYSARLKDYQDKLNALTINGAQNRLLNELGDSIKRLVGDTSEGNQLDAVIRSFVTPTQEAGK